MSSKLIIVLDDNKISRMLPGVLLRPYGLTTLECGSGYEALEMIKIHHVNCMLIVISMPDFNGIDLLFAILSQSKYSAIKLIAYTADADLLNKNILLQQGFHEVLLKPLKANDLLVAIGMLN